MQDLRDNPTQYLATLIALLEGEGAREAATLVRSGKIRIERTGHDNWNGGTDIWTVYIEVAPADFAQLGARRPALEEQIGQRLKVVLEPYSDDWYSVSITLRLVDEIAPTHADVIRREIRQNIIDGIVLERISWSGQLDDVSFLARLYDLQSLPSSDSRFKDAAGDIYQHRINNFDWEDDWVFGDRRFDLLACSDQTFLRFLCEMVHPVVRPEKDEAVRLVAHFNEQLRRVGWELVEEERIAGRPRFMGRPAGPGRARTVSRARAVAEALDAAWMQKEIQRLEAAIEDDPALAIGTAKDLVESCCKTILTARGIEVSRTATLPELTKQLSKALELVPDDIPDAAKGLDAIKKILHNLSAITQNIAELRGLYGSGHGRDGKHRGLQPRHARLAAGAAVTFIDFVAETHEQRRVPKA